MKDDLQWLMNWYYLHCEDHNHRKKMIEIHTLDNPGWMMVISLKNTNLIEKSFEEIDFDQSKDNWCFCYTRDENFEGAGGPSNFQKILSAFRNWADDDLKQDNEERSKGFDVKKSLNPQLAFLLNWFYQQCDEDWEHCYGISISTTDKPGWYVIIQFGETELEDKLFDRREIHRNEKDWIECYVENKAFFGEGGPLNLLELLGVFKAWVES